MSSRWRCVYEAVWMHRCVRGGILYIHDDFGVDRTMSVGVIGTSCLMAKRRHSPRHHGDQERRAEKLLITFHLQCLKMTVCDSQVDGMKSLGLVRSNAMPRLALKSIV